MSEDKQEMKRELKRMEEISEKGDPADFSEALDIMLSSTNRLLERLKEAKGDE